MARAKWFEKFSATTPTHVAAQRVVLERLNNTRGRIAAAARAPAVDPEPVHQLRVASRRLAAAVSIFRGFLDDSLRRKLRRAARRVRRAAGEVRDLDVQRIALARVLEAHGRVLTPEGVALAGALTRRRANAVRRMRRSLKKWKPRLDRRAREIRAEQAATSMTVDGATERLATTADQVLGRRLREFRAAGEADLTSVERLHELRIAGKRLRYSMEVFAACYPASFRSELYATVEAVQTELGEINDLTTLLEKLDGLHDIDAGEAGSGQVQALIDELRAGLAGELHARQQRFVCEWGQRHGDFEQRFVQLLAS